MWLLGFFVVDLKTTALIKTSLFIYRKQNLEKHKKYLLLTIYLWSKSFMDTFMLMNNIHFFTYCHYKKPLHYLVLPLQKSWSLFHAYIDISWSIHNMFKIEISSRIQDSSQHESPSPVQRNPIYWLNSHCSKTIIFYNYYIVNSIPLIDFRIPPRSWEPFAIDIDV